jgi:hypothetical protein
VWPPVASQPATLTCCPCSRTKRIGGKFQVRTKRSGGKFQDEEKWGKVSSQFQEKSIHILHHTDVIRSKQQCKNVLKHKKRGIYDAYIRSELKEKNEVAADKYEK